MLGLLIPPCNSLSNEIFLNVANKIYIYERTKILSTGGARGMKPETNLPMAIGIGD